MTFKLALTALPYTQLLNPFFEWLCQYAHPVWLDSGYPKCELGRYDILSAAPSHTWQNPSPDILDDYLVKQQEGCQLDAQTQQLPFTGGIIGYYEYQAPFPKNRAGMGFFGAYFWAVVVDHQLRKAHLVYHPTCDTQFIAQIKENYARLHTAKTRATQGVNATQTSPNIAFDDYNTHIAAIKDHIYHGDCYQINFTQQWQFKTTNSDASLYLALRQAQPGHFGGFFRTPKESILSFSPERFISIDDGCALTQPIKGTMPRGNTTAQDNALRQQLVRSEKNRAENIMIVDLLRNDFSIACKPHTVDTPALCEVQAFNNVFHLVSTVTGELFHPHAMAAFLGYCFPGGSITGAPKKKAMELIEKYEDYRRGAYCGSLFYMSLNNKLDSNILIRTLSQRPSGDLSLCAGGGIVFDSDAREEFEEVHAKIAAILSALTAS